MFFVESTSFFEFPGVRAYSFSLAMKVPDIFECCFDIAYLITIFYIGFTMWRRHGNNKEYTLFSMMCILLGLGDCFHLFPRMYSKIFGITPRVISAIGIGNLITAITMSMFYMIFLEVISAKYKKPLKITRVVMYILLATRIIALLLPQNDWIHNSHDHHISLIRNAPFILMGLIIVYLLFVSVYGHPQDDFRFMWLYVVISFGCYTPVALCDLKPMAQAALMIVKTLAYIKIAFVGFQYLQPDQPKEAFPVCNKHIYSSNFDASSFTGILVAFLLLAALLSDCFNCTVRLN